MGTELDESISSTNSSISSGVNRNEDSDVEECVEFLQIDLILPTPEVSIPNASWLQSSVYTPLINNSLSVSSLL